MTKRPFELIASTRRPATPPPTTICKRPRTGRFLQKVAIYENTMQTCAFFHDELLRAVQHFNDPLLAATPEGLQKSELGFRKQMVQYGSQFRSFCETWKAEADANIRLTESFRCLANAIEREESDSDGKPCSGLSMLNQGPETNAVIKDLIRHFAGVPSDCDVADWRELRALLPT
jgi:hypothetical protein